MLFISFSFFHISNSPNAIGSEGARKIERERGARAQSESFHNGTYRFEIVMPVQLCNLIDMTAVIQIVTEQKAIERRNIDAITHQNSTPNHINLNRMLSKYSIECRFILYKYRNVYYRYCFIHEAHGNAIALAFAHFSNAINLLTIVSNLWQRHTH